MRVLGIDPGYDRMGVAILEKQGGNKETVLYSDCLTTSPKAEFADRLVSVGKGLERIIKKWQPEVMAIETLFITKNQKTAMHVAEVRGVIAYIARTQGLEIAEYTPMEIKMSVAGYGKADKKQVTSMIELLVKLEKKPRLDDEYDAIGAALAHLAYYKTKALK